MDLGQLGLQTGAQAWRAGQTAVRTGALRLPERLVIAPSAADRAPTEIAPHEVAPELQLAAAEAGRAYVSQLPWELELSPAQHVRLIAVYAAVFIRGALEAAQRRA